MTTGEDFLRTFHARLPAVTGDTFGQGRTADGRSSYELLRDRVSGSRRVLELGCGDGVLLEALAEDDGRDGACLAGVDLSPEALALAAARPALAGTTLVECRAQQLPFRDGSFDACVAHMALMLMDEMEAVAAEAARVLAPGGTFACVVGGGAGGGEAYALFLDLLRPLVHAMPASARVPALGDRRTRTPGGFAQILGPAGFASFGWETVALDLAGPVERVWEVVSSVYDVATLDASVLAELRRTFLSESRKITPEGAPTPCVLHLQLATARRQ
ncbi:class I SAM-dependent methyltransferase [Streptomyces sp. TR06-5]|uniref:class I SAM-dependent methyltransferase n=1 Tax=Streptomyces sp. TR06-5 TaxID=3385976 RepID=UPI0039A112CB